MGASPQAPSLSNIDRGLRARRLHPHRQHGDHLIYTKAGVKRPLVVPMYREVPVFVIKNLLRTASMSREEFLDILARV